MPYEDTYPLKYTCGYSLNIFETNQLFSVRAPYCSQFLINANFANNLSINLGLQLLAIIVVIATKIRVNRYEKEKKGFHNNGISET